MLICVGWASWAGFRTMGFRSGKHEGFKGLQTAQGPTSSLFPILLSPVFTAFSCVDLASPVGFHVPCLRDVYSLSRCEPSWHLEWPLIFLLAPCSRVRIGREWGSFLPTWARWTDTCEQSPLSRGSLTRGRVPADAPCSLCPSAFSMPFPMGPRGSPFFSTVPLRSGFGGQRRDDTC